MDVCCLSLVWEEEIEREWKQFLELTQPFEHVAQGETLRTCEELVYDTFDLWFFCLVLVCVAVCNC